MEIQESLRLAHNWVFDVCGISQERSSAVLGGGLEQFPGAVVHMC